MKRLFLLLVITQASLALDLKNITSGMNRYMPSTMPTMDMVKNMWTSLNSTEQMVAIGLGVGIGATLAYVLRPASKDVAVQKALEYAQHLMLDIDKGKISLEELQPQPETPSLTRYFKYGPFWKKTYFRVTASTTDIYSKPRLDPVVAIHHFYNPRRSHDSVLLLCVNKGNGWKQSPTQGDFWASLD